MKTFKEFKIYYDNELQGIVRDLQQEAENIYSSGFKDAKLNSEIDYHRLFKIFGLIQLLSTPIYLFFAFYGDGFSWMPVLFLLVVEIGFLFKFGVPFKDRTKKNQYFKKKCKQKLIPGVIKLFSDNFTYHSTVNIDAKTLNDTFILPREAKNAFGEDYISGTIDSVDFKLSEIILAEYKRNQTSRSLFSGALQQQAKNLWARSFKTFRTVPNRYFFKGIYFSADFPKEFQVPIIVRPTNYDWPEPEQLKQSNKKKYRIYKPDDRINNQFNQVHMEDPALESDYNIYSTDQQQARYVLSTTMMERIEKFRKHSGKQVFICFQHSKMHLAIPHKQSFLEPKVDKQKFFRNTDAAEIINKQIVTKYFKDLQFLFSIVEDFKLQY